MKNPPVVELTTMGGFCMGRHFGEKIIDGVLKLKSEGKTHKEIGEVYNLDKL